MKQTANTMTLGGLVGAVALAGASQAYGTIVSVTVPTDIPGSAPSTAASTKEFWNVDNGTTSATKLAASDIEFGYLNSSTYNESFTGVYALNGGSTNAYYASNGTHYAYAVPSGSKVGTGGLYGFTQSSTSFTIMSLTYAGSAYAIQKPNVVEIVGFQFKAADGLIHDGWIKLDSLSTDGGATIGGGLHFVSAAYNTVPDASGGYINAGLLTGGNAVPEPGTLAALAAGAAVLGGVGLKRRRRAAAAAAAQD